MTRNCKQNQWISNFKYKKTREKLNKFVTIIKENKQRGYKNYKKLTKKQTRVLKFKKNGFCLNLK